jgi:hypothetical protein
LTNRADAAADVAAAADVFDQHLLSTLQVRTLQGVTDAALDEAGEALMDWKLLQPSCRLRGLPKLMQMVKVRSAACFLQAVSCKRLPARVILWDVQAVILSCMG